MKYFFIILMILSITFLFADELLKPYILADINPDSVETVLQNNNFTILGTYIPYKNTKIIVFTCDTIKKAAKDSKHGIFAAPIRLAITNGVVSYTNPKYWANAYRLQSDLSSVYEKLGSILGNKKEFGSQKGLSAKKLRKYKYMIGMPDFNKLIKIKEFSSHSEAVKNLEDALKQKNALVYKINFPDKNETLFGIKILGEHDGADKVVMSTLNSFTKGEKHSAYLPYEVLVSDNGIYIFNGKFRIAISFPDLSMGQFMKIKNAPKNIKKYVKTLLEK